jgi:topoisomerase IA-like protein
LEDALKLFSWTDISLGQHPETGLDLQIKSGRFGKYYAHGNLICSIGNVPDDFEASFEHAMARLDSKAKRLGV